MTMQQREKKTKGDTTSTILSIVPGVPGLRITVMHTPGGMDIWKEKERAPKNVETLMPESAVTKGDLDHHHLVMHHPKRMTRMTFPSQLQTGEEYFPGRCLRTQANRVPPNPRFSFR